MQGAPADDLILNILAELHEEGQAIQQLIATVVDKGPDKAFELLDTTRNHVMHGRQIDEIEDELPIPFEEIVDHAGGIAWTCIMNSIPIPSGSYNLAIAEINTFVHKRLVAYVHAEVGGDAIGDPGDPQLSEKSGVEISIIRDEQGSITCKLQMDLPGRMRRGEAVSTQWGVYQLSRVRSGRENLGRGDRHYFSTARQIAIAAPVSVSETVKCPPVRARYENCISVRVSSTPPSEGLQPLRI